MDFFIIMMGWFSHLLISYVFIVLPEDGCFPVIVEMVQLDCFTFFVLIMMVWLGRQVICVFCIY